MNSGLTDEQKIAVGFAVLLVAGLAVFGTGCIH